VPEKLKKTSFLVDYVDGDGEDEYKWLEGPHLQEHVTVADLLESKKTKT
jgi:hypothetical protein